MFILEVIDTLVESYGVSHDDAVTIVLEQFNDVEMCERNGLSAFDAAEEAYNLYN